MNPWILAFGGLGLLLFVAAVLTDRMPPAPAADAPQSEHDWHAFLTSHKKELI